MAPSVITKTVVILRIAPAGQHVDGQRCFTFAAAGDLPQDFAYRHELYLDEDVWRDLGEPDTITMTVEPGDMLNIGAMTHDHDGHGEHTHHPDGTHAGNGPEHAHAEPDDAESPRLAMSSTVTGATAGEALAEHDGRPLTPHPPLPVDPPRPDHRPYA